MPARTELPTALPFGLFDLQSNIGTTRYPHMHHDGEIDKYITEWVVTVDALDERGDVAYTNVASATLWTLDYIKARAAGSNIFDLLDAVSSDCVAFNVLFDEDGELLLEDVWGMLLVLDRLTVARQYRGHGIGPLVAAMALTDLSAGCGIAAVYPAPIEGDPMDDTRPLEVAKLGQVWAKIGFEPFAEGVWTLNLNELALPKALYARLEKADLDRTAPRAFA